MNIFHLIRLNTKKLFSHKKKAMFLIVPIALLVGLSMIITSEAKNILKAAEDSIFSTLKDQALIIGLTKQPVFQSSGSGPVNTKFGLSSSTEDNYSSSDVEKVEAIDGVADASIISALPISKIKTTDLFENISTRISQLVGIEESFASNYTGVDFSYTEGQPIPLVINANDFIEQYEDWQGKDSITVEFGMRKVVSGNRDEVTSGPAQDENFPIKTRAIDYEKEDLIGKEFTMEIGGLDDPQTFTTEPGEEGVTFTKLTEAELAENEADRKDKISPYWDYEKIKTPIEFTFKIVGVIESGDERSSYIPHEAASKIMEDYIQNQLDARTTKALDTDDLNNTFTGMNYDGLSLSSGGGFGFAGGGGMKVVRFAAGGPMGGSDSYSIPGLVIEVDDEGNVVGEYKDALVYENSAVTGTTMFIKVDDIYVRSSVVDKLNDMGYAYQDLSKLDVIDELKSTLSTVVLFTSVGFVGLSIVVIIFTMGKFVSEAKREIGIHRALGMTKANIRTLFISQAVLYAVVGYVIGAATGIVTTLGLAGTMNAAFDNFLSKTLEEAFSVVNAVEASVFAHIDWQMFGIYSALLLVITVMISLVPATNAANTSPVEAIRGE